jgi:biotin synthase
MINDIIKKALSYIELTKQEAIELLNINNTSNEFYRLIQAANHMTRHDFKDRGYVFAQIGLNAEPCSVNCKFCSMARDYYAMDATWIKTDDEIYKEIESLKNSGVDDLFLMTTADYDMDRFLKIGSGARKIIDDSMRLVANIGDFNLDYAYQLKEAGFTGVYHICRLREGIDTEATPEQRIKTLDAIKSAGLELYYCVKPIGPEHNYEEIAEEMIRVRNYDVGVMAVMRRIAILGSPMYSRGQISSLELSKIAAVARLVSLPTRAMNAHETTPSTLIGGVNQLYAEMGANPRDTCSKTEASRGYSCENTKNLLEEYGYIVSN